MIEKKSSPRPKVPAILATPPVRIPARFEGVQVNCCKNPDCEHYGLPETEDGMPWLSRSERTRRRLHFRYHVHAASLSVVLDNAGPWFNCTACGEGGLPLKSNQGIVEEARRMLNLPKVRGCCPNQACTNHQRSDPKAYRKFGYQGGYQGRRGNPRRQCKACETVFVLPGEAADHRVRQMGPEDVLMLKLLVGKMPLRRIRYTLKMSPITFYQRLERYAERFRALTREREARLPEIVKEGPALEIGVDRQDYTLNWKSCADRRNMHLLAVGSAENRTGYVFGLHPAFDPDADAAAIERAAQAAGDYRQGECYRQHARYWLAPDYPLRTLYNELRAAKRRREAGAAARQSIWQRYQEALDRLDIEEGEHPDAVPPPGGGMQVHSSYTLYGHFLHLKHLLGNAPEVGFYLDQDSGMRAACLSIWADRIKEGRAHAFYLRYNKNLTVDQKKARTQGRISAKMKQRPQDWQRLREAMQQAIRDGVPKGPWKDRWVCHPHTSMFEPEKELAALTPIPGRNEDEQADRHLSASLHGVSRFFMQVRRMLSLFERPHVTGNQNPQNQRYVYSAYAPYSPTVAIQMLDIFRGYYDYCKPGTDGATPAMRLGLADHVLGVEEVLGAEVPEPPVRRRRPLPPEPAKEEVEEVEELCP